MLLRIFRLFYAVMNSNVRRPQRMMIRFLPGCRGKLEIKIETAIFHTSL